MHRLIRISLFALLAVVLLASIASVPATAADPRRPNVIVIMADDLGYGDLSCYGATALRTPHADRLAAGGRRFTSGYCSASTCTPTRFSLMTGQYAFRRPGTGIAGPTTPAIIPPGTTTLPSILKDAGYATAVVGKWHLGLGGPQGPDWNGELRPGPLETGFDHCLVFPATNDRVPQVLIEDHRVRGLAADDPLWVGGTSPSEDHPTGLTHRDTLRMNWSHGHNGTIHNGISRIGFFTGGRAARFRDEDLADTWIEESVKWIRAHRDRPFFLFFASHDLHVPRMPHERFQGTTGLGFRGDSIAEFDWCVGRLMQELADLELTEDTLVVLCSDNGPVLDDGYEDGAVEKLGAHRPAGPFAGGKGSVWEGGTRTPFITHWPGCIPAGTSDEIVCTIDLAASLASLVGVSLPADACPDSFDVSAALLGEPGAKGRDHLVQQDNRADSFGFRLGDWKLLREKSAAGPTAKKRGAKPERLYDLKSDPGETRNVSAEHPEIVRTLAARLDESIAAGRTRPKETPRP